MSNLHAILSDLHRLLSTYRSEDFLEASKYPGLGRPLKDTLLSLASEAREEAKQSANQKKRTVVDQKSGDLGNTTALDSDKASLAELILRSHYGAAVSSMVSFANSYGLKLQTRPKESRERVAKRLATLMTNLPDGKKGQAAAELIAKASSQTQGWINVIKSSKR